MGARKRIGIVLPPRDPSLNIVEGSGLMPDDVREAVISGLKADSRVGEVVAVDLAATYIRNGRVYQGDMCLSDLDVLHWYFVTHLPTSWRITVLCALAQTVRVIPDPAGLLRGLDKFTAHSILRSEGLPTANFSLFTATGVHAVAQDLCARGPVLLKPRLGAFGQGIHMVKTARELIDAVEYSQSFMKEELQVFCEEYEENDIGRWISTTVIGGQLVYGYRKKPEKFVDNWKVYDANRSGGGVDYADPAPVRAVALKAAKALGCDIIGFDFIWSTARREYLIVDENTFPGMYPSCFEKSGKGSWDRNFLRMIFDQL